MSGAELSCQEVVEILGDYLSGAMPAGERDGLERHLAECDGCVNYLEQLRATIRLTGSLAEESVPPEALAALMGAFRAWHRDRRAQA